MGWLRRLSSVAVLLVPLPCGCKTGGARELRDTEGRAFSATCDDPGRCRLEQKSGPRRPDKPAQALLRGGRLVGICDVKEGGAPEGAHDCRPLTCGDDRDCPPAHGMRDGQCLNGRCSDPAERIGAQDSVMLCLAGTGLGRETPQQVERYALGLNCGSPCKVPAPCRQP